MSRSVLIAGDSNLKQLRQMFAYPGVTTLCVPGARLRNDRKNFRPKLLDTVKFSRPDAVILHIRSNDVGTYGDDSIVE